MSRRLTWWAFYRKVITIVAIAFMALLFCASEAEPVAARVHISQRADSVMRSGFEGAKAENAFCIQTHLSSTNGIGWVTKAVQADTVDADTLGLNLRTPCPDGMGIAHWHLDNAGFDKKLIDQPSWQDFVYVSCLKAPGDFNLILTKRGYFAYGYREQLIPCSAK